MAKGLLIDYRWCTGCHSCEVACQMEHHMPVDRFGIKLSEFIWPLDDVDFQHASKWQYTYLPTPLDACDLCEERVSKGKQPTCVMHCQAACIKFGEIDDLVAELKDHPKQTLFYLQ